MQHDDCLGNEIIRVYVSRKREREQQYNIDYKSIILEDSVVFLSGYKF